MHNEMCIWCDMKEQKESHLEEKKKWLARNWIFLVPWSWTFSLDRNLRKWIYNIVFCYNGLTQYGDSFPNVQLHRKHAHQIEALRACHFLLQYCTSNTAAIQVLFCTWNVFGQTSNKLAFICVCMCIYVSLPPSFITHPHPHSAPHKCMCTDRLSYRIMWLLEIVNDRKSQ